MKNIKMIINALIILNIIITIIFSYSIISNAQDEESTNDSETTIKSSYYKIDEDNKIISIVEPETDINTFKERIVATTTANNEKGEYEIYNNENKEKVVTDGIIKTGMVLHTNSADYPISVVGDINGDGKLNQIDLSSEIRHMVGLKAYQLSGVKKLSADITLDGKVDQRDLTKNIKCLVSGKMELDNNNIMDEIAPEVTLVEKQKVKNSVLVEALATDDFAMPEKPIYTFYLKEKDKDYEQMQSNESTTYTATKLKPNTQYTIKVETKDKAGNIGSKEIIVMIEDTTAPTVTLKKSEISTNFAIIEANSTDDVSMPEKPVYTFYLKEKDGNYEQVQESEKSTYTATELKANTEYAIKVTTKDEAGNTGSNEITFTTKAMPDIVANSGAIAFGETTWSNGKASIKIETNTGNLIQYQVNSVDGNWTIKNTADNLVHGDIVYARLTDGTNVTDAKSVKVEDTKGPIVTLVSKQKTTNSIIVTAGATDNESGMPTTPTYVFCLKEGTGSYEQKQSNTNANFTADGLNANTGYTIKVDVKDVAGNTGSTELSIKTYAMPSDSEVKQGAIIFSEPTWSNEKASITMSTSADYKAYTIQYQVNGTNGNWTTGTTAENLVDGDVLYARLTDGTNATGYTTISIKLPENTTIIKTSNGTTKTIEIYGNKVIVTENGTTATTTIDLSDDDFDQNTKDVLSKVYGTAIEYRGNTDINAKTWRIFYIDFENKYKDGVGTIYLKADWTADDTKLKNYSSYTPQDTTKLQNMNPKWWKQRKTETWNENELETAWLCDTTQWTKYKNENAKYAIAGPSVEMYCDSYNSVNHPAGGDVTTNYKLGANYSVKTYPGYIYTLNDTESTNYSTGYDTIDYTNYNSMYCGNNKAKNGYGWWLASPLVDYDFMECYVDNTSAWLGLGKDTYTLGICPLVSLPSNTKLTIK